MNQQRKWIFAADRGGTFTDIIGFAPDGNIITTKLLSISSLYKDAATEGIHRILKDNSITENCDHIKLGTTVATNALLERKGTEVVFLTTLGFADILQIAYQNRPDLFKLEIKKPSVLYRKTIEIGERIDASGKIIISCDEDEIYRKLEFVYNQGISSLAICLMHSWINPLHEQKVMQIAKKIGFTCITCSSLLIPIIKIVIRGQTTVLNSYLTPVLEEYIKTVQSQTNNIPLQFMQSNGGTVKAECFTAKNAILSGPAGGAIAVSHIAELLGYKCAIGFDMGGTSTDVSRFSGSLEKTFDTQIANIPLHLDMINIVTVAAGGGSILQFDGQKMAVGPESAGASPGPLCYGVNGPLTITDANLLLGRIIPQFFPKVFGASGDKILDSAVVTEKFTELAEKINKQTQSNMSIYDVAEGFINIANQNMGNAIKEISIARGFSLEEYALICFGGAGAQHASALAKSLGISSIVLHPLGGVFSAYGIALADVKRTKEQSVLQPFTEESITKLKPLCYQFEEELRQEILNEGIDQASIITTPYLDLRVKGTESVETVKWLDFATTHSEFIVQYKQHYGIQLDLTKQLQIVNIRVEATGVQNKPKEKEFPLQEKHLNADFATCKKHCYFNGQVFDTPVYFRENIQPGNYIPGPAIIVESHSTIVIEPGFTASMNQYKHILLNQQQTRKKITKIEKDPILLEIFSNLFMHVARQMGITLQNTAYSTNIKERMDFSCAVFSPQGNLVANAPHIPVHLGAMGETVKNILQNNALVRGDVYISNNPFAGGSHLPDVTMVSPVFDDKDLIFIVACRGHHADIGGITPGSMPPFSKRLEEEGVIINNFKIVNKEKFQEQALIKLLSSGKFPARNISERISDLQAQLAANHTGCRELGQIISEYGLPVVQAYMEYIQENAKIATQRTLGSFLRGQREVSYHFLDYLDDGNQIAVKISIEQGDNPPDSHRAHINFSGTSQQLHGNLNAPIAVVKAAILYCLRALIDEDIPLNDGCFIPIEIFVPAQTMLNPDSGCAVVGGNVETSQRIVDTILGALQVVAASQGTMNNFTFGKEGENSFGYYETICGGAGAGYGFHGEHAVHTHMTNTLITDPEVLELRFPEVRLEEFSIRPESGGYGKYCGGNGVIRRIHFLEKRNVTIISERRGIAPYGLKGGMYGRRGLNTITRNGVEQAIPAKVSLELQPGETVNIYTPGGGGYGVPE